MREYSAGSLISITKIWNKELKKDIVYLVGDSIRMSDNKIGFSVFCLVGGFELGLNIF